LNNKEKLFKEGIEREKYRYSWDKMEDTICKVIGDKGLN
jgi:hypothetical protein